MLRRELEFFKEWERSNDELYSVCVVFIYIGKNLLNDKFLIIRI